MRVKAVRTLAVTLAALLVSIVVPGTPAGAAGRLARTATEYVCDVTPRSGQGTINVRVEPTIYAPVTYSLRPNDYKESSCTWRTGGWYDACGGGNEWIWVHLGLNWAGYVARKCVTLTRHNV